MQMKEGKENVTKENDVYRMSILYLELEMSLFSVGIWLDSSCKHMHIELIIITMFHLNCC